MPQSPNAQLLELLSSLFGRSRKLFGFLWSAGLDQRVINDLPGPDGISVNDLATAVIDALQRRNLLDGFFDHLNEEFPNRVEEIEAARERFRPEGEAEKQRVTVLPPMSRLFVGRQEELSRLDEMLVPGGVVGITAISGMGGIGKSRLACEYARTRRSRFQHVLWVDARGRNIIASFADLATPLKLPFRPDSPARDRAAAVSRLLSQGGPHLLIFDNIQHLGVFESYLPQSGDVRVLLTTRLRRLGDISPLRLELLPPRQAMELLCGEQIFEGEEHDAAEALCEEVGRLTLALKVLRGVLSQGVRTPAKLLRQIETSGLNPVLDKHMRRQKTEAEHHQTREKLFAESLSLLKEMESGEVGRALLEVGAWCAPEEIPRDLLTRIAEKYLGQNVDEESLDDALEALVQLGLASVDEGMSLHRLVRAHFRPLGDSEAKKAVLNSLADITWETETDTLAYLRLAAYRAHLEEAADWVLPKSPDRHLHLVLRLSHYLHAICMFDEARRICERLASLMNDTERKGNLIHSIGYILSAQGDYSGALERYNQALDIKWRTIGEDHPDTAATIHSIGRVLLAQGDYSGALERYNQALDIKRRTIGEDYLSTASTINNIGHVLLAHGDYSGALERYNQALDIKHRILGEDHPSTAVTIHSIGRVLLAQGDYSGALERHNQALDIKRRILGEDHPSTAVTIHDVGRVLSAQGDYSGAFERYSQALDIYHRILGEDHPDTATAIHNIGRVLSAQGDYSGAFERYSQALDIYHRTLGEEHPNTATTRNALRAVQRKLRS